MESQEQTAIKFEDKPPKNGAAIAKMNSTGQFQAIEEFTRLINQPPAKSSVQKTPDGKAETLVISAVEMTLDEIFLRQWGDRNFQIQVVGNEVMGWLDLWVIDPQTGREITRTGGAAVTITVDKVPDNVQGSERNKWALDMANKKSNAMHLSFPKLISMCRKNAAQTICKKLGRDLNRKFIDTYEDYYTNLRNDLENLGEAKKELTAANTNEQFAAIWSKYPELQQSTEFQKEFLYYKRSNIKTK